MTREQQLDIIRAAAEKRIRVAEAARLLGVCRRTMWRKVARYRAHGPEGLVHRLTGRPSNHSKPSHIREQVIALYRQAGGYRTLSRFVRTIVERHGLDLSRETIRLWLVAAGLWRARTPCAELL